MVAGAIILFLPSSGVSPEDPDAPAALEWDGNMTDVGLEVEAGTRAHASPTCILLS